MKLIGVSPPLVEILNLENGCFIPKGDFRGIQNFFDNEFSQSPFNSPFNWHQFISMAKNQLKGDAVKTMSLL